MWWKKRSLVGAAFLPRPPGGAPAESRDKNVAPTRAGQKLGVMGQTSRSADARNWMAVAPHLHFEVRNAAGESYDPVEFLSRFVLRR